MNACLYVAMMSPGNGVHTTLFQFFVELQSVPGQAAHFQPDCHNLV